MKKPSSTKCADCDSLNRSLFSGLDEKSLALLDKHKTCNVYKKNQVIFHEGNRPLGLFCLTSGKVKIHKTGLDGREQIVRLAKPGDMIGYRSFLGEEFYSATAVALDDSCVCFIDKNDFFQVLKTNENFSLDLIHLLARELREAEDMIRDMAQKSVRERVAEVLLLIKEKYGVDASDPTLLNSRMTREELASYVGTATETLIRLLSDLKEENIIETQGRRIRILNPKALFQIANLEN